MKTYNDITEYSSERRSSVTIGKFDGLHLGHRALIDSVLEAKDLQSVVVSFDIFPVYILEKSEKNELLEEMGIDVSVHTGFTPEFMKTAAEDFIKKYLIDILKVRKITVGRDFRFGYGRKGDIALLEDAGREYGFDVQVVDDVYCGEEVIRSSRIRKELSRGNLEEVNKMLGYKYFIKGEVVHGRELGRNIGYPTANIIPAKEKLLPRYGVYYSRSVFGGKTYYGITNIGVKPTVGGEIPGVETYLIGCDDDLYGMYQRVELLKFIRSEKKFESIEKLKEQLDTDIGKACRYYKKGLYS